MKQPEIDLRSQIEERLEAIVDPCSRACGAPAGLVSMGLVGAIELDQGQTGHAIKVTLRITEPGCMMGALFQLTAQQELSKLEGVESVRVDMDYGFVWGPEEMSPAYRSRLAAARSRNLTGASRGRLGTKEGTRSG